jgi:hypothetical protein
VKLRHWRKNLPAKRPWYNATWRTVLHQCGQDRQLKAWPITGGVGFLGRDFAWMAA